MKIISLLYKANKNEISLFKIQCYTDAKEEWLLNKGRLSGRTLSLSNQISATLCTAWVVMSSKHVQLIITCSTLHLLTQWCSTNKRELLGDQISFPNSHIHPKMLRCVINHTINTKFHPPNYSVPHHPLFWSQHSIRYSPVSHGQTPFHPGALLLMLILRVIMPLHKIGSSRTGKIK